MRNFWALPAAFRLVLASQHSFSVQDDLLAYPQYEVLFPNRFFTESYAAARLFPPTEPPTDSASNTKEASGLSHGKQNKDDISIDDDADQDDPDSPATYERLILQDTEYLCRIPVVAPPQPLNETEKRASAEEEKKELMRATDRGWELLQGMQGDCIYFISGWWSYSFCYNKEIKQFHQLPPSKGIPLYPPVEDTGVPCYVLGKFPKKAEAKTKPKFDDEGKVQNEEKSVARLETKGESRYMVQRLGGGTECDLTGRERKIEVQFHCHPNSGDRIGMIKEVSTCSYLMVIHTPRLCNDIAFLPPTKDKPNAITCAPIVADTDLEDINQHLSAVESSIAAEASQAATVPPRPIIGGIAVGEQKFVGGPGREIEKSVVVGGGKETFIGIVAASDGRGMSEKEMRKNEIRSIKDVEQLKKDLGKLAGGKGWRLELVETPRGREFRGIIEADDDEDEKKKKKADKEEGESEEGSEEGYKEDL